MRCPWFHETAVIRDIQDQPVLWHPAVRIRLTRYALLMMLISLLAGCGGQAQPSASPEATVRQSEEATVTTTSNETDPAQPIVVAAGETFTIRLSANPSTGYAWQQTGTPDTAVVRHRETSYIAPSSTRLGAAGVEVWTFEAVGRGTTTITLAYRRSWERNRPPLEQRTFTVTVR